MAAAGRGFAERLVKEALLTMQSNYIMLQKITVLGAVSGQRVSATERGIKCLSSNPKADSVFVPQSDTAPRP